MIHATPLVVRQADPFNAETPIAALAEPLTPNRLFYVRTHSPIPSLDRDEWRLAVDGHVEEPLRLAWDDIRRLRPERRLAVTLECAGNGRALMARPAEGAQWHLGAAGTAYFTGVPLVEVLRAARIKPGTLEILFEGADRGEVAPGRTEGYRRSLPMADALAEDSLLAWAMNGEDLAPEHGFPLRLVAPGWYGMASVKWLTGITALTLPFDGHYQVERYVYDAGDEQARPAPVTRMRVRSVIARPGDGERIPLALTEIAGTAWSGSGAIACVEIGADDGASWAAADLGRPAGPHGAVAWRYAWLPPAAGAYTLTARATDAAGNVQPLEPLWNRYGYGNNVAQRLNVVVAGR